jgi:hypothetical protein
MSHHHAVCVVFHYFGAKNTTERTTFWVVRSTPTPVCHDLYPYSTSRGAHLQSNLHAANQNAVGGGLLLRGVPIISSLVIT